MKAFSKFENTTEALAGAAALTDSKLSKGLKKFLKKNAGTDELAVLDAKLGGIIKEKLGIQCIWRSAFRVAAQLPNTQHAIGQAATPGRKCLSRAWVI